MADHYIGEIRLTGFNFAPSGWALCDGRELPINEYQGLFRVIGTTYGGDGTSTFQLPDLRGRVPLHGSPNYPIGAIGGSETVTLTTSQIPTHSHPLTASNEMASSPDPEGNLQAAKSSISLYAPATNVVPMASVSTVTGRNMPHDNMQPFLVVNFVIALEGDVPTL